MTHEASSLILGYLLSTRSEDLDIEVQMKVSHKVTLADDIYNVTSVCGTMPSPPKVCFIFFLDQKIP